MRRPRDDRLPEGLVQKAQEGGIRRGRTEVRRKARLPAAISVVRHGIDMACFRGYSGCVAGRTPNEAELFTPGVHFVGNLIPC